MVRLPRIVVAAPASGHGKTTLTIGLLGALARELKVSAHKVGPDYIDPGFHALATGRPGRNLDPVLCGPEKIVPLLLHGALHPEPAELAIIEGVMGLFDGRLGTEGQGSTAQVAALTKSPVLLCVDVSHTSRSIGALVHGMATWQEQTPIAGVVLNKVSSPRQEREVLAAIGGQVPVVGSLPRRPDIAVPSRHLGLVPAAERAESLAVVEALADYVAAGVELAAIKELAGCTPELAAQPWEPAREVAAPSLARPVVAVAGGRAFTFRYAETTELLAAAGCRVVEFDPLTDPKLPEGAAGLYLGGGFPEVYAGELAANTALLGDVRDRIAQGLPTVAECAGLLYLVENLEGKPMAGAISATAAMHPGLKLGYRFANATADNLLARAGEQIVGHEFHRTRTTLHSELAPAWCWDEVADGVAGPGLHAAYLHTHWAGVPQLAQRFADAVHAFKPGPAGSALPPPTVEKAEPDLHHHGDADARGAALEVAVNVHPAGVPDFLEAAIRGAELHHYPDVQVAREALAERYALPAARVLPTAGAAEAFALIARALPIKRALLVHPQFTEPEAALRAAGVPVVRHLLAGDFALEVPKLLAAARLGGCDTVFIGNPTNPTGVLHQACDLLAIRDAGLQLVVDEAFLDAVVGEPETLLGQPGVIVIRSLTKLWSIPGVRAGFVLADPEVIEQLAQAQPPWPLASAGIAAMVAVVSEPGQRAAVERATSWQQQAADLRGRLAALPLHVVPGQAPFVLVDVGLPAAAAALARHGVTARRCGTFPGLGDTWLRIAARPPETNATVVAGLSRLLKGTP